ncbi:unnamed protein product [Paramecium sonneborni]|uniref:VWFA domain-containing protein n=1 Tax=Paramecium sonneborni TaxID=65129 RepID=A0A8S1R5Y0_9CILI|nr:unnamed protein product [Paramecium sonneborni]
MIQFGSEKTYLKQRQTDSKYELDPNIFTVRFSELAEECNYRIHQGDALQCKNCSGILNIYSNLESNGNSQQFKWVCEFCEYLNEIQMELEEIPQNEEVLYLTSPEIYENTKKNAKSIIFCVDISGSMSSTTQIKGRVDCKSGISQEEYENLKQFIDPADHSHYLRKIQKEQRRQKYISRKQCLISAIEQQIKNLKEKNSKNLVGLVTFNNEIVVYGDGSQKPIVLSGEQLNQENEIKTILNRNAQKMMQNPVGKSAEVLIKRCGQLQENGQTALGPALLSALELAKVGKPGSMIIICTDGLANYGLGSLDGDSNTNFYEKLGQQAAEKGIIISLVTIKGEGCKIDQLAQLVEKTNGIVTRVAPEKIGQDFENIINDEVIGTQVELQVTLHKALQFREDDNIQEQNEIRKYIGNITKTTIQSFEYQLKSIEELEKQRFNINKLKSIPFQIRINYTNLKGEKLMRVLTKNVQTTQNIEEAEKKAQVDVIHKRMAQKTAQLAKQGNYEEAYQYNQNWVQYINSNPHINSNLINQEQNQKYSKHNAKLANALKNQEARKQRSLLFQQTLSQTQPIMDNSQYFNQYNSTPINQNKQKQQSQAIKTQNSSLKSIQTPLDKEQNLLKNNNHQPFQETPTAIESQSFQLNQQFQQKKNDKNSSELDCSNSITKFDTNSCITGYESNGNLAPSQNESDEDQDFTTLFFYEKASF